MLDRKLLSELGQSLELVKQAQVPPPPSFRRTPPRTPGWEDTVFPTALRGASAVADQMISPWADRAGAIINRPKPPTLWNKFWSLPGYIKYPAMGLGIGLPAWALYNTFFGSRRKRRREDEDY